MRSSNNHSYIFSTGMLAKFEENFDQMSTLCKKKGFLKALEDVDKYRKGIFPGD
jgi:hypothetical protein